MRVAIKNWVVQTDEISGLQSVDYREEGVLPSVPVLTKALSTATKKEAMFRPLIIIYRWLKEPKDIIKK